MDVRFSGQTLHCHIRRSELERLASGRAVDLKVDLPRNHAFRISVRPSPLTVERGGWALDSDPTGIWLTVPRAEIEQLGQTTTFAERLMREFPLAPGGSVQVILEATPDTTPDDSPVLEITPQAN